MVEADNRDIYRAPAAPPPRGTRPSWVAGLLLATLPSLIFFAIARWLVRSEIPGLLAMVAWIAVIVLTFYGVGVFMWSGKSKPTWGRVVIAVLITGFWMEAASFLVAVVAAFLRAGR